jgi:hypothetical protein
MLGANTRDVVVTALSTTVTLTPASRRQCVNISAVDDHIPEFHESFTVHLDGSSLPPYVLLSPDVARVTIFNVL